MWLRAERRMVVGIGSEVLKVLGIEKTARR
jgi:hypothetical protein